MINYLTVSILSARSWAWIFTFRTHASLVWCTVWVYDTFRSAAFIRITEIFRQTRAGACTVRFSANGICSTWWWWAHIFSGYFYNCGEKFMRTMPRMILVLEEIWRAIMLQWKIVYLLGCGLHCTNGLPVYPLIQTHIGVWLIVRHSVFTAHEPGQGSLHFWLIHARWLEQSLLLLHSGLQFGGIPMNSLRQEQEGLLFSTRHWAFGPQGDGWQGSVGGTDGSRAERKIC